MKLGDLKSRFEGFPDSTPLHFQVALNGALINTDEGPAIQKHGSGILVTVPLKGYELKQISAGKKPNG